MKTLVTEAEIAARVAELGREISGFYGTDPVTMVVLANGALLFGADLARRIASPLEWDVLCVNSYHADRNTGKLTVRPSLKLDPAGRKILVVDEVLDSGATLAEVCRTLLAAGAAEVRTAVMVEKRRPRPGGVEHADWCGFELPDRYLVGYGLDSHERFRNLPYIAELE